jgi:hypothetical protein
LILEESIIYATTARTIIEVEASLTESIGLINGIEDVIRANERSIVMNIRKIGYPTGDHDRYIVTAIRGFNVVMNYYNTLDIEV